MKIPAAIAVVLTAFVAALLILHISMPFMTLQIGYTPPPSQELLRPAPHHFWKSCRGNSVIYLISVRLGPIVWFCEETK